VYALLGVALALSATLAVLRFPEPLRSYAGTQLALQSLLFVVPWIALNVSFQPSLDRFLALTESYRTLLPAEVSAGHYETLRSAFAAARNPEGQIAMIGRAVELTRDPYEYYKLTRVYEEAPSLTPAMLGAAERSLVAIFATPDSARQRPVGRDAHAAAQTLDDVAVNLTRAVVRLLPASRRVPWATAALHPLLQEERRRFELGWYLGNLRFDARDYPGYIQWITRALRDSGTASDKGKQSLYAIYHSLGVAYAKTGNEALSIASFRQAVSYPQATASTWSDYGFACYTYSRFAEAAPAFANALRRDSTDVNALYCLGKIYFIEPSYHETGRRLLRLFLARETGTPRANDARDIIDLTPEQLRGMSFTK
jgi:tetratricopeptide (TPR) repeat protein